MEEYQHKKYRATFEYMIMPRGDSKIEVSIPKGPFEVEVYMESNGSFRNIPKWKAKLLPTMSSFGGRTFKNSKDCMSTIASMFKKQTSEWMEY